LEEEEEVEEGTTLRVLPTAAAEDAPVKENSEGVLRLFFVE